MKTIVLEVEDSKFEQFMTVMNSLKSDLITKFQVLKETDGSSVEEELLEDLKLFKSGQLETKEITDIEQYIVEPNVKLRKTKRYASKEKKFFKKHPELINKYAVMLKKLSNDPFEPSLKLHRLQGNLEKFHAVRLTYKLITSFPRRRESSFFKRWIPVSSTRMTINTHDDVY